MKNIHICNSFCHVIVCFLLKVTIKGEEGGDDFDEEEVFEQLLELAEDSLNEEQYKIAEKAYELAGSMNKE